MQLCSNSLAWRGLAIAVRVAAGAVFAFHTTMCPARTFAADDHGPSVPEFECRWTKDPITIDGKADETAWESAELIDSFTAHWANRAARSATRARLLWDHENLYFLAEMDDADLYADLTEHDAMTWLNDVFELFFKPAEDKLGYYEFQVNAANTTMDMYLPSRGSGGYARWAKAAPFHLETAVVLRGTLDDWQDTDLGWSAEGRIPWSDFAVTGGRPRSGSRWRASLCRYDYSVAFDAPDLSCSSPLTRSDFHRYEDYGWLRFVGAQ
jgi:hypothetical protein